MTLYILIQYWDFVYIANKYYFFFKNDVCVRCLSSLCPYKGTLLLPPLFFMVGYRYSVTTRSICWAAFRGGVWFHAQLHF